MTMYAAAPTEENLIDVTISGNFPIEAEWKGGLVTHITTNLQEAVDEALEISEKDGNVLLGVVIQIVLLDFDEKSEKVSIVRSLPLLAFRGDLFEGVTDVEETVAQYAELFDDWEE